MRAQDTFRLACRDLLQQPLRTFLCALSVAVGTGALTLISSLALFANAQVNTSLHTLGLSGLVVYLEERTSGAVLSAETAQAMKDALPQVENAMPVKAKAGVIRAGHSTENALFLGVDEKMGDVMRLEVLAGRLLTQTQAVQGVPVCVVDDELARSVFGRVNVAGRKVRLRLDGQDTYFTIQGVVKAQTAALGGVLAAAAPHLVYIPYCFLAEAQENADQVFIQCGASATLEETESAVKRYLTERRPTGGTVQVQNLSGMVETVQRLSRLCAALFSTVGGVTLCVALIGVLCGMLAAACEKAGEIGVFLALGAKPADIRHLFLLQSILLCLSGGVAGMTAAAFLLRAVSLRLPGYAFCGSFLLLSILCGVTSGVFPAVCAAHLDPVDAMRK